MATMNFVKEAVSQKKALGFTASETYKREITVRHAYIYEKDSSSWNAYRTFSY